MYSQAIYPTHTAAGGVLETFCLLAYLVAWHLLACLIIYLVGCLLGTSLLACLLRRQNWPVMEHMPATGSTNFHRPLSYGHGSSDHSCPPGMVKEAMV